MNYLDRTSVAYAALGMSRDMGFSDRIPAPPAMPGGPGQEGGPGPGYLSGSIQILTPTDGVDFTSYIARLLAIVKRNWYAVMPESARLGDRGRVMLRFRIMRDGSLPGGEPILEMTSGKRPLDRAAVPMALQGEAHRVLGRAALRSRCAPSGARSRSLLAASRIFSSDLA